MIKIKHNFKPGMLLKGNEYLIRNNSFSWAFIINVIEKNSQLDDYCYVLLLGKNETIFNTVSVVSLTDFFEIVQ